jgi:hypothetical protein
MNENKLKAFAKQLVELAGHLQDGDAMPATTRSISFLLGEKHVGFSGPDAAKCEELFGSFYLDSGWGDKFSESYAGDLLRKVLGELYKSNTTATAEAALVKHEAEYKAYQKRHSVFVPLSGIALHVPLLKIGRVTVIHPGEPELARRLGKNVVTNLGQHILRSLTGRVLAEFEAVAEPIARRSSNDTSSHKSKEHLGSQVPGRAHRRLHADGRGHCTRRSRPTSKAGPRRHRIGRRPLHRSWYRVLADRTSGRRDSIDRSLPTLGESVLPPRHDSS